jgi:glutathione S-transferase
MISAGPDVGFDGWPVAKREEKSMRLYMHPVSNTSRPLLHYIAENKLPVEQEMVDLMTGAHHKEPYITLNPNRLVPTLVDGDFILTESSTILKYLADKFDLPTYPKDLKKRAKVNEMMDWFNTNFYRDYAYGVVYPQIYPHHKRPSDAIQTGTIAWNKELTKKWLGVLNDHWLDGGKKYLTGDELTIADYFGAALLTCGHVIRTDFKAYPNIVRWLGNIEKLPNWSKVNEAMEGFREAVKGQEFDTV